MSPSIIARPHRPRSRAIFFSEPDGKPDTDKSRNSALGIGVPGTVAGLALALEKYGSGRFTLAQILKPAIELARDGFVVTDDMADTLSDMYRRMATLAEFGQSVLPQRRHAAAGRRPADPARSRGNAVGDCRAGTARFYEGPVAERLAKAVRDGGGIMTADDLKSYQAVDPHPGARQLSRLRHRLDAAALLRRHGAAGDAEHSRRISDGGHEAGLRALAASS